jgi:hypothetical protein
MAIASLIAAVFLLNLVRSPSPESTSGSVMQTPAIPEIITDSDADQAPSPYPQKR